MSHSKPVNESKRNFETRNLANGQPNPKYVDVLKVDPPIAGQKYGVFVVVSPDHIIKKKELFFFEEFVKRYGGLKNIESFNSFVQFIAYKYNLQQDQLSNDYKSFLEEERDNLNKELSVENDYKNFIDNYEDQLQSEFDKRHSFQTNVRGIKSGGNFPTLEEAQLRAKMLREYDDSYDYFVGEVGAFLPVDVEAYKTGNVEYLEDELNQLVHEKIKNAQLAKQAFEQRVLESKTRAIEENKLNAEKTKSTITQDIDENGNLFSSGPNTVERSIGGSATATDVARAMYEGDVIIGKNNYNSTI